MIAQLEELKHHPIPAEGIDSESCMASWETFYKHNKANFFKNRNYLSFAFDVIDSMISSGCSSG